MVVYTGAVAATTTLLTLVLFMIPGWDYTAVTVEAVSVAASSIGIPVAMAIAILRHRLYDVDALINGTLVYGTLTALLALLYAGCVFSLQFLAQELTGQVSHPPLVIVGSTLGIAALSQPLRRAIQSNIDRRFYRQKYDAARTLATFSAALRYEIEMESLCEQLLTVVQDAMQPEHITMWLRDPVQQDKRRTRLLPRIDEESPPASLINAEQM